MIVFWCDLGAFLNWLLNLINNENESSIIKAKPQKVLKRDNLKDLSIEWIVAIEKHTKLIHYVIMLEYVQMYV